MKTAIMFSGQGAQTPGMMKDLLDKYPESMGVFRLSKDILGRDIYNIAMNASKEVLNETVNTQPCMLACELAALRILKGLGITYCAAIGFSVGEWAALVAAGVATEEMVLSVIEKRAIAMQNAVPIGEGGMAVMLGKSEEYVEDLCKSIGNISPSIYNCSGNISVSGTSDAIDSFLQKAEADGAMASRVAISIPSHCSLMQPAVDVLAPILDKMDFKMPSCNLLMNAVGDSVSEPQEIKNNLKKQIAEPVKFRQTIENLLNDDYDTFIEIGPGKVLSGLVKRTSKALGKKVNIIQFNSAESVNEVLSLQ